MTTAILLSALAKMAIGFFIGSAVGQAFKEKGISPLLGIIVVVVLTLGACFAIDSLMGFV